MRSSPDESEEKKGRLKMQTAARSNLVLTGFSSLKVLAGLPAASTQAEFYREIAEKLMRGVYTHESYNRLGDKLIAFAHHAYTLRQMDAVEQASQMLMGLPLSSAYQSIGGFYKALWLKRRGEFGEAGMILESLAGKVPPQYRSRVIMSLAGLTFDSGDFKSALPLYIEAGHAARDRNWCDWFASLTTQRMLAVLKSADGDNRGALACLENQFPLARAVGALYPHEFCNYLNSLATEMGEVGRLEEAHRACRIVLASPFASAYPEWRETRDEIERKRYHTPRSVVLFAQKALNAQNVLRLPVPESGGSTGPQNHSRSPFQEQATITSLQDWKQKMVNQPNDDKDDEKSSKGLDDREMLLKIVELSTIKGLPDEALREMVEALQKIVARHAKKGDEKN